ncbi:MAG: aminodeoxychorismate lyase [Gammaproteobacteria bacterium]|nr:aminodeoxychorismate lyase [Gammaproteobacteria bacterium]
MRDAAVAGTGTLVDGQPDAWVGVSDRGLQFGDGLFETVAVVDGRPCHWQLHLARLVEGCKRLRLPTPDCGLLGREAASLCAGRQRATLKIYWTAGDSPRGYARPARLSPRRIVQVFDPPPTTPEAGPWRLTWCRQRWGENPQLAGIKHLNRLEQVLARDEVVGAGFDEGLMQGQDGRVVSGTMTNLLLQSDDRLVTPSLDAAGIRGVTRSLVVGLARDQGMAVDERVVSVDEVNEADAVFLCNSLLGIVRVASIDQRVYDVAVAGHAPVLAAGRLVHQPDVGGWAC